ncbi:MAG: tetratricopeptide repeat protein [bacterium]|nr:tetratricopeptide repeat protein [bacterium]
MRRQHLPSIESRAAKRALLAATAAAVCSAVTPLAGQGAQEAAGPEAFRTELRAIAEAAGADWGNAKSRLAALLDTHEGADYVRYARSELIDLHRRITFESTYEPPEPDDLISGKLVSYDPKSGRIKLIYTRETMQDFADPNGPGPEPKKQRPRRGRKRPGTLPTFELPELKAPTGYRPRIHPALFRSCKIEVTGARYTSTELLTGIQGDELHRTVAGEPLQDLGFAGSRYVPTVVVHQDGGQRTELFRNNWLPKNAKKKGRSRWPMKRGAKYKIVLSVTPKSLNLRINRKSVCKERWREPVVGKIGITDKSFDQLTLTGQVEPAWIHGLLDGHRQTARNEFASRYEPEQQLPAWVFTTPKVTADTSADSRQRYYPGKERPKDLEAVRDALNELGKGNSTRVLFRMIAWQKGAVPALVREYLKSYAYMVAGSFQKAIRLGERVVAADPEFGDGRIVLGRSYLALRRHEDAERQFREVLRLRPNSAGAHSDLAMALVRQRQAAAARKVIGDAISRGLSDERLQEIRRVVDRIIDGPAFGKSFTVTTKHYRITSDIDEAVCKNAGKVLENALPFYRQLLGDVEFEPEQRFQVYLFSGEQGYKRYLDGLKLRIPIHTAGVYSPELQQLLIWNLAAREDMLRTIRHEGFHQYFDMLTGDAPVWLNEGLAEYFEVSRFKLGRPSAGIVQPRHVRALRLIRPSSRGSIEEFLKITPRRFYGPRAALNYSKSWAMVRYLRSGTPTIRAVFDRLVRALIAGKSRDEALAEALENIDMERLSKGFWSSVDRLIK